MDKRKTLVALEQQLMNTSLVSNFSIADTFPALPDSRVNSKKFNSS